MNQHLTTNTKWISNRYWLLIKCYKRKTHSNELKKISWSGLLELILFYIWLWIFIYRYFWIYETTKRHEINFKINNQDRVMIFNVKTWYSIRVFENLMPTIASNSSFKVAHGGDEKVCYDFLRSWPTVFRSIVVHDRRSTDELQSLDNEISIPHIDTVIRFSTLNIRQISRSECWG